MDLLAFLDVHNPHIVAIQKTKIGSSITTSELFPEACPYNIFRKDRRTEGPSWWRIDAPHPLGHSAHALVGTGKRLGIGMG